MTSREKLYQVIDKWLAVPDKQAVDIIIATAMHAAMPGDPLWLLLIKASGSAKTELLRGLTGTKYKGNDFVYTIDGLTPHTLVSGLNTESKTDPSLLNQVNDKLLIIKDFSEILSLNWGEQKQIFADLRQSYDGYLEKHFGSGVGKRGGCAHFGLIAASTSVIDKFNILTQELGERFLKVRLQVDEDEAVAKAAEVAGKEKIMRQELGGALRETLEYNLSKLDISSVFDITIPDSEIQALAKLVARLRSEVSRYRQRHIIIPPDPEVGTRLVKQFKALYRMSHILLGNGDYDMVLRVARDCIPLYRLAIISELKGGKWMEFSDLSSATNIPSSTLNERLEDLLLLKVIEKTDPKPVWYYLSGRMGKLIQESGL